jgi:hypothetical protein
MDHRKDNALRVPTKDPAPRLPDHELIRFDAAAHPERTHDEHVEAAREIAGRTYFEDLRRISPAAQATLSRELEADDLGLQVGAMPSTAHGTPSENYDDCGMRFGLRRATLFTTDKK